MSCSLPADCFNEILEKLEGDKITLRSCLLVNRLWCKISVRILWRDIWSFKYSATYKSSILSTLISCLPNESKELLCKNEIFISTPTSKPPLFNYISFCKVLSIDGISQITGDAVTDASQNLKDKYLISKEMLKMFIGQVSSLKSFNCVGCYTITDNIPFTSFPGAKDCLTDLSELYCDSIINSEFFYQLSRICHNLRSLTIRIESKISNELKELVSSQNNLKNLKLSAYYIVMNSWADIIPALMKHSNTLTKLHLVLVILIS